MERSLMLEKMLADMLGINTDEMAEMATGMQTLLKEGVGKLNDIHAQNSEILALLKEGKTGNGNGTDNGNDNRDTGGGT
jgi:hypothetical protein